MLNRLKQTTKQTAIYSLGNLSNKLAGLILLPLYTAYLTPADYGIYSIFEVTLQILIVVLGLRLQTAMLRICSSKKDESEIKSIIFTTIITTVLIVLPFTIFLSTFSADFSRLIFQTENYEIFFKIVFGTMFFGILNHVMLNIIRFREKALFYAVITSVKFLIILLSNIYFIVYTGYAVKGLLISRFIAELFLILIVFPFALKNIRPKLNLPVLSEMIAYGLPLIFSTISGMILNFSDRYIIKLMLGSAEVGVYSMGYKIAGLINVLIIQSFQTGFLPIAYKMVDKPEAKRYFSKILTYFSLILSFLGLLISLYGRELFEIMSKNDEWLYVNKIIPFLVLLFVLRGIEYNLSLGTHYVKKTKYNAYIVMSAAVLNIGLNLLLIPKYSIYGAAVASIISIVFMGILFYRIAQKFYYIPFEIMKIVKSLGLAILLFAVSYLFFDYSLVQRIIIKIGLVISYPILLYYIEFFDDIELLRIKQSWRKWRNPRRWFDNFPVNK